MNNDKAIAIRFNYNKDRNDPEEILTILTGYIKFYKQIGILSLSSINEKDSAKFDLISLQNGSAIAWIRCIKEKWDTLILNAGMGLADYIDVHPEVSTREDLESISNAISSSIVNSLDGGIKIDPHLNLELLGKILYDYSALNSRLNSGEDASFGMGVPGDTDFRDFKKLNNNFSFNGNVKNILSKRIMHHKRRSKFHVNIPVNKGDNIWRLEELVTTDLFQAKIADNDWLNSYQSGFIDAIGPHDIMDSLIEYDEIISPDNNKKKQGKYKNAKIIEVIGILRNRGEQGDIFQK